MSYKPLPKNITIRPSKIEGLGLFASEDILINYEFGISHVLDSEFDSGYSRTPLGGFYNHSEDPNCEAYREGRFIKLRSIKEIKKDDELTARYSLYKL
jgi:SET domain-containing protein